MSSSSQKLQMKSTASSPTVFRRWKDHGTLRNPGRYNRIPNVVDVIEACVSWIAIEIRSSWWNSFSLPDYVTESHATTVRRNWNQAKRIKISPPRRQNSLFCVWPDLLMSGWGGSPEQTREDWNVNFRLPVVEYLVRSQNVQRKFESDIKRINVKRLCDSLLSWKTSQDLLQIVQLVTTIPSQLKNEITPLLEEYDDILDGQGEIKGKAMKCNRTSMRTFRKSA